MEVAELKALVNQMYAQKKLTEEAKEVYGKQNALLNELKATILNALDEHELDRFEGDNCKVSRVIKSSVKFPKNPANKSEVFDWIAERHGKDVLLNMLSINSISFNSFFNQEAGTALEKGELDFTIPGVEAPNEFTQIRINKK